MTDQVASLNKEPNHFQIGEPGAPCDGHSTCTDCVVSMIYYHEKHKFVSAHEVRQLAAPHKDPCRGLNAVEALRAINALGIHGYEIKINATASDAIRATDVGVVLFAEGYGGHPLVSEAEVGGRTDLGFTGPHANSLWGRRNWQTPPKDWHSTHGAAFKPGWRVWGRDPDHHWGDKKPPYDRFRSTYLVRAMDALIGNQGWRVRMIIARTPSKLLLPKVQMGFLAAMDDLHVAPSLPSIDLDLLPDFGSEQSGGLSSNPLDQ